MFSKGVDLGIVVDQWLPTAVAVQLLSAVWIPVVFAQLVFPMSTVAVVSVKACHPDAAEWDLVVPTSFLE